MMSKWWATTHWENLPDVDSSGSTFLPKRAASFDTAILYFWSNLKRTFKWKWKYVNLKVKVFQAQFRHFCCFLRISSFNWSISYFWSNLNSVANYKSLKETQKLFLPKDDMFHALSSFSYCSPKATPYAFSVSPTWVAKSRARCSHGLHSWVRYLVTETCQTETAPPAGSVQKCISRFLVARWK